MKQILKNLFPSGKKLKNNFVNKKEIYLSFILLALAFVILLATLSPSRLNIYQ